MTEELSQDKIKMVNKTNKKITIKHYLNTYVRPIVGNEDTEKDPALWRHAVYVRITFNRLTAKVKSATDLWCTVQEFNDINSDVQRLFERETLFLMDHISRAFLKFEEVNGTWDSLMVFDINEFLEGFSYENFELDNVVDRLLIQSMTDYLSTNHTEIDYSALIDVREGMYKISPLELLSYYNESIPALSEFKKKYSEEIWTWKILYRVFKKENVEFNRLGASVLDLTHGEFKSAFMQSYPLYNLLICRILADVESLINDYYLRIPKRSNHSFFGDV